MHLLYLIRAWSCVKEAQLVNSYDFIFVQVPFQDALDLVRTRKVFLKGGYAYIPHQDIISIVLNDFRTGLSKALAVSHCVHYISIISELGYLIVCQVSITHVISVYRLARPFSVWAVRVNWRKLFFFFPKRIIINK